MIDSKRHDPMCPWKPYADEDMNSRWSYGCQCDLIARVAEREARRHHYVDMQGGPVRRCCAVCRTHVPGHPFCVLAEGYSGPLPEGHRWEEPE